MEVNFFLVQSLFLWWPKITFFYFILSILVVEYIAVLKSQHPIVWSPCGQKLTVEKYMRHWNLHNFYICEITKAITFTKKRCPYESHILLWIIISDFEHKSFSVRWNNSTNNISLKVGFELIWRTEFFVPNIKWFFNTLITKLPILTVKDSYSLVRTWTHPYGRG